MRGGHKLARRLAAQHEAALRRFHEIGRIGLAALELAYREGPAESRYLRREMGRQPRLVEAQGLCDVLGAGKADRDRCGRASSLTVSSIGVMESCPSDVLVVTRPRSRRGSA